MAACVSQAGGDAGRYTLGRRTLHTWASDATRPLEALYDGVLACAESKERLELARPVYARSAFACLSALHGNDVLGPDFASADKRSSRVERRTAVSRGARPPVCGCALMFLGLYDPVKAC